MPLPPISAPEAKSRSHTLRAAPIILWLLTIASIWAQCLATDYYKLLNVSRTASTPEIKKAFRKLSIQYHPDKNSEPGASDKFASFAHAYDVLSDPEKRKVYDKYGEEGLQRQAQGGDGDDMDPFAKFFEPFGFGGGRRRRNQKEKASPIVAKLYLSLSQLFFGELLHVEFNRPVTCLNADECIVPRNSCSGPGVKTVTQKVGPGFIVQNQMADEACVDVDKGWDSNCQACPKGRTEMQAAKTSVYVEPGMLDNEPLTMEGIGTQKLGYEPGDVVFRVVQMDHPLFERRGPHLYTTVYLSLLEALVGFSKKFPMLSKETLTLNRTSVTHDGEVENLKGKGMPVRAGDASKTSVDFGNLYITYRVQFPGALTSQQQADAKKALQDVTTWKFEAVPPRIVSP